MHIPDDPLYYEKFYFTPGDPGFHAWKTQYAKIGVLICWDQWYPEGARLTAMQGAEILFYPTAIGWHPSEKKKNTAKSAHAWETIQRSHAVANGCYVCVPNRIGLEKLAGAARRHRVLGPKFCRRHMERFWRRRAERRSAGRSGRPGESGRHPHPLALPAGSADRCVREFHEAVCRLSGVY